MVPEGSFDFIGLISFGPVQIKETSADLNIMIIICAGSRWVRSPNHGDLKENGA